LNQNRKYVLKVQQKLRSYKSMQ